MPIHDWTRVPTGTFHHFHATWIVELTRALNAGVLPTDYYAQAEQYSAGFVPDVLTLRTGSEGDDAGDVHGDEEPAGGIALAKARPKVQFTARTEIDVYASIARSAVVRHRSGDRVVTVIEVLSPGNKSSKRALAEFLKKARTILRKGRHLLLIDLFPPGPRDPQGIHGALWTRHFQDDGFTLSNEKPLTLAAYVAGIDDVDCEAYIDAYVEPIAVGDSLPDMPLFLTPEIYVNAPLEASYRFAYEAVPQRWRRC